VTVLLKIAAVLLLGAPAAIVLTLLVFPAWRLFEEKTGVEAYGHSGPAEWCYVVDYAVLVCAGLWLVFRRRQPPATSPPPPP
jgi:hypothetical protein